MPFRFVHTADIHLDSPLRSLSMRNVELADLIGDATRQVLVAIVDLCLEEQVDALVIAGDLYDGDQTSMKTARFLANEMGRLHEAGIAVFKVRGNHDALSRITKELVLPPSLKVFGSRPQSIANDHDGGLHVVVHGLSFAKPHAPESLFPLFGPPVPDAINVGIMHTSLGGSSSHDVYAPCNLTDLQNSGFRYWALGHIHQRSEYAGATTVVMPGIPQGRDINEAGAKSVTLVTIGDDGSCTVTERAIGIAQFERVEVDLSKATSLRDVVDMIGRSLETARQSARSEHLVARLSLVGATPLSWRLHREVPLLTTEAEQRAEHVGKVWIEKVVVGTDDVTERSRRSKADPVVELAELMQDQILTSHSVREEFRQLAEDVRSDLPPELRDFGGSDEAEFGVFLNRLLADGSRDVLAHLIAADAEDA